ncbi:MAG: ribosome maturation factor RimP [Thermacetogeniaceae bacterium]
MKKEALYKTVEELLKPMLVARGIELVDITFEKEGKRWFLRVYIDKPGGIQLHDCEEISNFLGEKLDALDLIPHHYYLEVSSPGIERPLRKPDDFIRFRGRNIVLKTTVQIHGQKNFLGILKDFANDEVILETKTGIINIPFNFIAKAKLKVF